MLSRRHIRIKVLQALYAYFQTAEHDMVGSEKSLFRSLDKFYEAYLYLLMLMVELGDVVRNYAEESKTRLVKNDPLDQNAALADNTVLHKMASSGALAKMSKQYKITWQPDMDLLRKLFLKLKKAPEYNDYVFSENKSPEKDTEILVWIYKQIIMKDDVLLHLMEEKNIYWQDDKEFVDSMVLKSIKQINKTEGGETFLLPLYKDEADDLDFAKNLFRKTIVHEAEYEKLIADNTDNWDVERIAMVDILMLKMALMEYFHFAEIPLKVTINEYLEISKIYSTPKSKIFINGVLDKMATILKADNKIQKRGKGLIND